MNENRHPSPPEPEQADTMRELRMLLLAPEQQRLASIEERVEKTEQRKVVLAHDLPNAIAASDPEQLALALRDSVERTLHRSVREDSEPFVEVLYPVIGQSVRRSIAEALRTLVSNLNRMIEQGTSPRALGWRLQAWRSGMPYSEIVLRHSLLYHVERVFLIHRHTGLLIQHVERPDAPAHDSDAVSGMLTAIQDFVRDSFGTGDSLDSVDIGNATLWVIDGPQARLACLVRGTAPASLHTAMSETLESIHRQHGTALRDFQGDEPVIQIQPLLEPLLREEARAPRRKRFWHFWPQILLATGLILLLAFWVQREWEQGQWQRAYLAALKHEEGIVPLESEWQRGTLHVRGLRDPLSTDPAAIAARMGLEERIQGEWLAYHSLASNLVTRRVVMLLEPHADVHAELVDGVLRLSGVAPGDFIERMQLLAPAIAGVTLVDTSLLVARDERLLQQAKALLNPPENVYLSLQDGHLEARGSAPVVWVRESLPDALSIPGITNLYAADLGFDEETEAERITLRIHRIEIPFEHAAQVHSDLAARMQPIVDDLLRLHELTEALGQTLRIRVIGYTDAVGSMATNLALSWQRAEAVKELLVAAGVSPTLVGAQAGGIAPGTWQIPDERARHAVIRVQRRPTEQPLP